MGFQEVLYLVSFLVMFLCLVVPSSSREDCPISVSCGPEPSAYHPHPDDCSKFCQCVHGKPVSMNCSAGTVFSDKIKGCVHRLSPSRDECTMANAIRECNIGKVDLIPHPTTCERYYNCSDTIPREATSSFSKYEKDCTHPKVFDINKRQCVNFENAECGEGRVETNRTAATSDIDSSLCVGNYGAWPIPSKLWTPFYTTCFMELPKVGGDQCPNDAFVGRNQIFHPRKRECTPVWEIPKSRGGMRPSCRWKLPGLYKIKALKTIYYRCPGSKKIFCDPPLRPNEDVSRCTSLHEK